MAIDPELQPFIDGLARAWPESGLTLGAQRWRERAEVLAAAARPPHPPGSSVEDRIVAGAQREVRIRLYRPEAAHRALPGIVYMHGGGWVIGSHLTHDSITAQIALRVPAVVASVHYALAPEHPYPAAVEDCRAVLDWMFEQAPALGVDPQSVFTCGDSAGGNLATVLAWQQRNAEQRLRGQVLVYPCVDIDFTRASYLSEANAPFMTAAEMIWFWQQYCPDPAQRLEPEAVPMRAADLTGMAPALVMVAEHDVLRDEGIAYAQRLRAAGVATDLRVGRGLIHGHLRAGGVCRAAAREFDALCGWIRRAA